jgi:hypothetical protein
VSAPRKSIAQTLSDSIDILRGQLKAHITWAADARTHPNLTQEERTSEYRFHLGYALALNQALVTLGETFQDVEAAIQAEVRINRETV